MALTFDNAARKHGTASATSSVLTLTATADAVLLVFTHCNTGGSISAIAANGNALTRLTAVAAGTSRAELWGLTAPPTGTLSISLNSVGVSTPNHAVVALTYAGAQQPNPFGGMNIGTVGAAATLAASFSATATDLVVVGFATSTNGALVLNAGATTRSSATHSTTGRLVVGDITGAATVSASASASVSGQMNVIGIHLLAKPAGASTLADQFTSDTINGTNWTKWSSTAGGVAVITVSSSAAIIIPDGAPAPFGFPAWGFDSTNVYVMSGQSVYARIDPPSVTAADVGSLITFFGVINADPLGWNGANDEGFGFEIAHISTSVRKISCMVWADQDTGFLVTANASTITYIAANHAWFQVRDDGTNWFWEVAPDNGGRPGAYSILAQQTIASVSTLDNVSLMRHRCRIRFAQQVLQDSYSNTFLNVPMKVFAVNTADVVTTLRVSATETTTDTLSASANTRVTVRVSATETTSDTLSASAFNRVALRVSATDATDTLSASAKNRVTLRLSATDVTDTLSASAFNRVALRISATDVTDTLSASAFNRVAINIVATDTTDTLSISGYVVVRASIAATDAPDILSASVTVVPVVGSNDTVTAFVSATDPADSMLASAYVVVRGFVSATDPPDVVFIDTPHAPAAQRSAGHGNRSNDSYQPANELYWDAREKFLLSLRPAILEEPGPQVFPEPDVTAEHAPIPRLLGTLRIERRQAITDLDTAKTMAQLRMAGRRLRAINAQIEEEKRRIAAIQYVLDEPKRRRARQIERMKKQLALLDMARELLHLQDHV